ncbi:hypothetical protein [Gordonia liuliyuniae]|uniref:Uncharacterized protein n=1 Tax=Gordonia liuliyuniae TaxID=2911517 RepID=A0ABS9IQG7_9ACTN|nr:hypothetical protein [Gordonia liuliyuniae]MCF8587797.1 hypothetical protein [Gordonia liuliyuniae]
MSYYRVRESSNAHVEPVEFDEDQNPTAAEFYFDYTINREIIGRYGYFAATRGLAEVFQNNGFTGVEFGRADSLIWHGPLLEDEVTLPDIVLLRIVGRFMKDDLSLNRLDQLVVSEPVYRKLITRDPETIEVSRELSADGNPILSPGVELRDD